MLVVAAGWRKCCSTNRTPQVHMSLCCTDVCAPTEAKYGGLGVPAQAPPTYDSCALDLAGRSQTAAGQRHLPSSVGKRRAQRLVGPLHYTQYSSPHMQQCFNG